MNDFTDRELLDAFARQGDEGAFAEVVRRYGGLVFGAALRRLGDHGLAEEAAQNVFTTLARKARALADHPALAAWLQKTAAFESARAMEKEQNRRRTMKAWQDEQSIAEANADAPLHAALPLLDEAVAALPETDRQVLLLRYWQSQPFKNIANAMGSSVDACEKRAGRALEKLSRLLRRRGVALGVTVLGAGLTAALTKAAVSPALLARLTPAALAAAKAPAGVVAGWMSLLFMKSKLTLTAIALAILALCGTAGWFAGAAQSASRTNGKQDSGAFTPVVRSSEKQAVQGNGTAGKGDARENLRALLEAAQRDLLTADYDPVAKARAVARVAQIAAGDIRAALEMAESFPGGLKSRVPLAALLLQQWAQSDGAAACEFALTKMPKPQMGIPPVSDPLKVWAAKDPRAALAWFRQRAGRVEKATEQTTEWMPISSIRWIMGAWALQDMPAAVEAFSNLKDKQEIDGAIIGFSEMSGGASARVPVLDALLKVKKDEHQGNTLHEVGSLLRKWSEERPEELARWLDQQDVPKSYHGSLGKSILQGWLRLDAPAAVEWWMKAPGGYPDRGGRMDDIVGAWSESDVFAAAEWLAKQPLDKNAARSMTSLAAKVAQSDAERGWQWALSIPEEHYRKDALKQVATTWVSQDSAAAGAAVAAAELDPGLKAELLKITASSNK